MNLYLLGKHVFSLLLDELDSDSDYESIQENVIESPIEHLVNVTSEDPFSIYKVIDELNHLNPTTREVNDAPLKDDNSGTQVDWELGHQWESVGNGGGRRNGLDSKIPSMHNVDGELPLEPLVSPSVSGPSKPPGYKQKNIKYDVVRISTSVLGCDMEGCSDTLGNMINSMSVKMVDH
ncbi:hypothetical protein L1987_27959 [Smallanthus sonchifolius]|uniref:Uncharacterized protein n=1 Tax=Smallanthus sonchifolius TaxID=185202 RepID=A0ACB9IBX9_9ASTR|nr:hypothetical protein L1987_27959 [Smallanthus sonchifolius]